MTYLQLDATTWIDPASGMTIADPGPGNPLTVTLAGTAHVIPMPRADRARALLGHNPPPPPPLDPSNPALAAAGVSFWRPDRTPAEMQGKGNGNGTG